MSMSNCTMRAVPFFAGALYSFEWLECFSSGGIFSKADSKSRRSRDVNVSRISTLFCFWIARTFLQESTNPFFEWKTNQWTLVFVTADEVSPLVDSGIDGDAVKSAILDPWNAIFGFERGMETPKVDDDDTSTQRESRNSNVLLDMFSQWTPFAQDPGSKNPENDASNHPTEPRHSNQDDLLAELLESMSSRHQHQTHSSSGIGQQQLSLPELIDLFWNTTQQIQQQLNSTFKDVFDLTLPNFNLLQLYYYMLEEELTYNPVYKRRQHAFMKETSEKVALQLADGLFLSQLAYVNDCARILEHLQRFQNNSWVMVNCTTESKPYQPAHFLTVRRVSKSSLEWNYSADGGSGDGSLLTWWEGLQQALNLSSAEHSISSVEAILVVRGTKDIADMMSDALLEPVNYGNEGKAHDGICRSSIWLHDTYRPFLEQLIRQTGRSKLKLWLVGHSLGAGTAALACLEFNKPSPNSFPTNASLVNSIGEGIGESVVSVPIIDAYALGFGTPAVLSKELSEEVRSKVTTVVNDADCVPRMSGATLLNMVLSMASSDHWKMEAQIDLDILSSFLTTKSPFPGLTEKIMNGIKDWIAISQDDKNKTLKNVLAEKFVPPVLFPPGECIHLYRDGTAWRMVYFPCSNFTAIEGVSYMVDDHLIPTGYYRGLLGYIRELKGDLNWRFDTDLMDLPV